MTLDTIDTIMATLAGIVSMTILFCPDSMAIAKFIFIQVPMAIIGL